MTLKLYLPGGLQSPKIYVQGCSQIKDWETLFGIIYKYMVRGTKHVTYPLI